MSQTAGRSRRKPGRPSKRAKKLTAEQLRRRGARRQERYRIRQTLQIVVIQLECSVEMIEDLIDQGHLRSDQSTSKSHISRAVTARLQGKKPTDAEGVEMPSR